MLKSLLMSVAILLPATALAAPHSVTLSKNGAMTVAHGTPSADATVTQIVEAVGYVTGTNSVTVALLDDNGGVPGKILQSKTVKNLDTFGNCCNVAVDKFRTGVPVKAGTTYWVAALLPKKKQASTWDTWNFSTADRDVVPAASYNGTAWVQTDANYSAFAVYGR